MDRFDQEIDHLLEKAILRPYNLRPQRQPKIDRNNLVQLSITSCKAIVLLTVVDSGAGVSVSIPEADVSI